MIKHTSPLVTCFLLMFCITAHAQDSTTVQDFELWTGISIKKSFLDKKLEFSLSQEFRFDENALHIDNFFTEIDGSYKIIDGLEFGLGYRFIRDNRDSGYGNEQRFISDLSYKHKLKRFRIQYRLRYQRQDNLGESRDEGDYATSKLRLRLKSTYNIKRWKLDPYLAFEGFYTTETNYYDFVEEIEDTERISGFQKLRFTLGTNYKVNKLISIGAFYRIERELMSYPNNYNTPGTFYIGGINLSFKL